MFIITERKLFIAVLVKKKYAYKSSMWCKRFGYTIELVNIKQPRVFLRGDTTLFSQ